MHSFLGYDRSNSESSNLPFRASSSFICIRPQLSHRTCHEQLYFYDTLSKFQVSEGVRHFEGVRPSSISVNAEKSAAYPSLSIAPLLNIDSTRVWVHLTGKSIEALPVSREHRPNRSLSSNPCQLSVGSLYSDASFQLAYIHDTVFLAARPFLYPFTKRNKTAKRAYRQPNKSYARRSRYFLSMRLANSSRQKEQTRRVKSCTYVAYNCITVPANVEQLNA